MTYRSWNHVNQLPTFVSGHEQQIFLGLPSRPIGAELTGAGAGVSAPFPPNIPKIPICWDAKFAYAAGDSTGIHAQAQLTLSVGRMGPTTNAQEACNHNSGRCRHHRAPLSRRRPISSAT